MEYPSIPTVWERDPENKMRTLIEGRWANENLEALHHLNWTWTEKVDGTNVRIELGKYGARIAGRAEGSHIPNRLVPILQMVADRVVTVFQDIIAANHDSVVTVFGEGYGNKIQKDGNLYLPDHVGFVLFDINVDGTWYRRDAVEHYGRELPVRTVPMVGKGPLQDAVRLAREGFASDWGPFPAEGLVMRPPIELFDNRGNRVITKIKTKDF